MRTHRWPAIVVLAACLAGAVAYDQGAHRGDPAVPPPDVQDEVLRLERSIPHLRGTGGSERWFCGGGGAGPEAPIAQQILLGNVATVQRTVTVTVLRDAADVDRSPVVTELALPPGTTTVLPVDEVVASSTTGAVVEGDGAGVVVEQRLRWTHGDAIGACATSAAEAWHFVGGSTARDATYRVTLLNPFPDDAVVDIRIETDEGTREPTSLQGLVVPGRSVTPVDVAANAERREVVAVHVQTRSGRVVAHRVHARDGTLERTGLSVSLGAPAPAMTWSMPYPSGGIAAPARYLVTNVDDIVAEVDVEVRPDDPDRLFDVEPFALTVEPGRFALIDLSTTSAAARLPEDVTYAGLVLAKGRVPIVAEHWVPGRTQLTLVGGIPVQAMTWTVPTVPDATTGIGIVNLSPEAIATVRVQAWSASGWVDVAELDRLELNPGRRLVLRGEDLPSAALRISSTAPVVVGRRITQPDGLSLVPALPERGTSSEPDPFGLLGSS
jgi:hypothetical protein